MTWERGHHSDMPACRDVRSWKRGDWVKGADWKSALPVALLLLATPALAADPANGKANFTKCGFCHRIGEGAKNVVGPELNGVVGRPAGSVVGYAYSQAMKTSGKTWDEASLRAYLAAPSAFIPGTRMTFAGLGDPAVIDDVIAYLKTFKPDGSPAP
ncbi:hypothetical protein GCM10007874_00460 [Labrys miyagiensis]|uniref:Cytochrome c domain-containing protein n=1 Tax=Labrys miyagiensis TaxID=346912 RepID=A0ABQ6CFH4_9HYPH|nr:cytochrome c family protein [Labrys miyagiensis]GLS17031.1 hypothetical protein GCM10007874_00460 [Labrys miyagiensis]